MSDSEDNVKISSTPRTLQTNNIAYRNKLDQSFTCNRCGSYFASITQLRQHVMRRKRCGTITDADIASELREKFMTLSGQIEAIPRTRQNKQKLLKLYQELESCTRVLQSYDFIDSEAGEKAMINLFKELSVL